jgi:AhpD family alkylhydroperoxidase
VFRTLGRHRGLFRKWLVFAGGLMPGGKLRRSETELVILSVAQTMGCAYEWDHHERLARRAGASDEAIAHVREGQLHASCFSPRESAFLRVSQQLYEQREVADETWQELAALASEVEIIELCLLVGHYQMLAMTLNTLRVPLDAR